MAEYKASQFIIGNQTTRATLTSAYTGNTSGAQFCEGANQLELDVEYTMGAAETGNSIEIRIQYANPNDTNTEPTATEWYQVTAGATSSGATTLSLQEYSLTAVSSAGTYDRFAIQVPIAAKYYRVSIKETGVESNAGSASVLAALSYNRVSE